MFSLFSFLSSSGPSFSSIVHDFDGYMNVPAFAYVQPTHSPDFVDPSFFQSYKKRINAPKDLTTFLVHAFAVCTLIGVCKIVFENQKEIEIEEQEEPNSETQTKQPKEEEKSNFKSFEENEFGIVSSQRKNPQIGKISRKWNELVDSDASNFDFVCIEKDNVSFIGSSLNVKKYTEIPVGSGNVCNCTLFGEENWY